MERIEKLRLEMLQSGYSKEDAEKVCRLEAEYDRECAAIRQKYDELISEITGRYVDTEKWYEGQLAMIEERIGGLRQELEENSLYSQEDIDRICEIEKDYEQSCARWDKTYMDMGLRPEGLGHDLRILHEKDWRDEELKEIDEKYRLPNEQKTEERCLDGGYDCIQQRMIQEGYYPMELIEDHNLRHRAAEQWYKEQMLMIERGVETQRLNLIENGIYTGEDIDQVMTIYLEKEHGNALVSKECIENGYPLFGEESIERSRGVFDRWREQISAINENYGFGWVQDLMTREDLQNMACESSWRNAEYGPAEEDYER